MPGAGRYRKPGFAPVAGVTAACQRIHERQEVPEFDRSGQSHSPSNPARPIEEPRYLGLNSAANDRGFRYCQPSRTRCEPGDRCRTAREIDEALACFKFCSSNFMWRNRHETPCGCCRPHRWVRFQNSPLCEARHTGHKDPLLELCSAVIVAIIWAIADSEPSSTSSALSARSRRRREMRAYGERIA